MQCPRQGVDFNLSKKPGIGISPPLGSLAAKCSAFSLQRVSSSACLMLGDEQVVRSIDVYFVGRTGSATVQNPIIFTLLQFKIKEWSKFFENLDLLGIFG